MMLFCFSALAGPLTFTDESINIADLPEASANATVVEDNDMILAINSDGSFEFATSGRVGETLVSSTFKFSATTSQINITAYGGPSKYIVYLEKKGILGWGAVHTVTYYTGGTLYGFTFNN